MCAELSHLVLEHGELALESMNLRLGLEQRILAGAKLRLRFRQLERVLLLERVEHLLVE